MDCYMGIDIGTSGIKAIVLDGQGRMVCVAGAEQSLDTPADGWAQQDPLMWWKNTKDAMKAALSKAKAYELRGIGLTGQMLGAVFLDKSMRPIRPCLVWCDQRSAVERDALEAELGLPYLLDRTGNYPLTGYWLPKLKWMEAHEPEHFSQIDKILFPKDYIRFLLTGEPATDVSDGGGSALFDVAQRDWSWELIDRLGYPRHWFPPAVESHQVVGRVRREVAEELGISPTVPVVAGAGDQLAGGIGNGIVREGLISSTIGTSGVVFACTDSLSIDTKKRGVHSFCHGVRDKWSVFGCTLAAGGSFKWMRQQLSAPEQRYALESGSGIYDVMCLLASTSPPGSRGVVFLPYLIGERTPYPDPYAKGVFYGLSLRSTRTDMMRAVMEGIVFSLRDSVEILREFGVATQQVRASGGGGKSSVWRQMQADIFNTEVITLNYDEGPALGAAILSMIGTDVFPGAKEACENILQVTSRTEPIRENVGMYEALYQLYRSLYPALQDSFSVHATLEALQR